METSQILQEYRELKKKIADGDYKSYELSSLLQRFNQLKKIIEGCFVEV